MSVALLIDRCLAILCNPMQSHAINHIDCGYFVQPRYRLADGGSRLDSGTKMFDPCNASPRLTEWTESRAQAISLSTKT